MKNASLKYLFLTAGIGLATSQAFAGAQQITVANNGTPENFYGGGTSPNIADNNTVQANGISTYTGQAWDLEALTTNIGGGNSSLSLVAGYNLAAHGGNYFNGLGESMSGAQSNSYYGTGGGDIFISLSGGATDQPNSGSGYAQYANNDGASGGSSSTPIYNYVIDTHDGLNANGTLNVYQLSASSILTGVENPGLNSNPWIFQAGSQAVFTTVSYSYLTNQSAASVAATTGVFSMNSLKDDSANATSQNVGSTAGIYPWGVQETNGLDHNVLTLNMSNLSSALASSSSIYFSYTMECGNDSIKGLSSGGFSQIPDGGSTLILLGSALSLLHFLRRKQAA